MFENRPQLRNHVFATAILFGTAVAGASTLDFMLTSDFQLPRAQAEPTSHTPYAGDPRYVWEPARTAPTAFSGALYDEHFQDVSYTPETSETLDGAPGAQRDASEEETSQLYRDIAALYADELIADDIEPSAEPHPVYDSLTDYAGDLKRQAYGSERPS